MVARNLRNHANDVWGHAEVVALCESRFQFSGFGHLTDFSLGRVTLCRRSRKYSKYCQLPELPQALGRPLVQIFSDKVAKWLLGTPEIMLTTCGGMRKWWHYVRTEFSFPVFGCSAHVLLTSCTAPSTVSQ